MHTQLLSFRRIIGLYIVSEQSHQHIGLSQSKLSENSAITGATGGMTVDELSLRDGEWSVSRESIRLGRKKVPHDLS